MPKLSLEVPGRALPGARPAHLRRLAIALVAVVVLGGLELRFGVFSKLAAALAPARLESRLGAAGPFAPLVYVVVMAVAVVSPLPTLPLDLLAGRVFGPLAGTLYSVTGATLGSLVSFELARWLGRDLPARRLRGHIQLCSRCSDRILTKLVFFGRLLPLPTFDLLSYAAGLSAMSAARFAVASFLGMLPLTFLYNAAGHLVLRAHWIAWAGGAAMTALFFLVPYWIERYDLFSLGRLLRHGDPEPPPTAAALPRGAEAPSPPSAPPRP